ncbi:MAG TPA: GNAT family N-acetyltransferase [Steroidobacteraceae bacterium]|nr:GNAT family N-acetyltransferase [Steroidobacteraceae bacterium]
MMQTDVLSIAPAQEADLGQILGLIKELAEYENLASQVVATEANLRHALFGPRPAAEALIARLNGECAGFALYFHNFSTFLGRHGLYLEDLLVRPAFRAAGVGKALLRHLARVAIERECGRFEWAVLDWNRPARDFYESLGAEANPAWVNYRITGEALERLARDQARE